MIQPDLRTAADEAAAAEAAGYDMAWAAETNHDVFMSLVPAAAATERIRLGTSIAVAFGRSPMILLLLPGILTITLVDGSSSDWARKSGRTSRGASRCRGRHLHGACANTWRRYARFGTHGSSASRSTSPGNFINIHSCRPSSGRSLMITVARS